MRVTHRLLGAVAAVVLGTTGLQAQAVNFQGTTAGCLYAGATPCTTATSGSDLSLYFLTYVTSQFNVTTSSGFVSVGGAATPDAPGGNVNNLGSFALGTGDASYDNAHFLLDVMFSAPTILSSQSVFHAALQGSVSDNGTGGVDIAFSPSAQSYVYELNGWTGTFDLHVNNVSITGINNGPAPVTGYIRITSTPEPATTALFATGLLGLIPVARSRRRKPAAV